jgi:hypothetical protein
VNSPGRNYMMHRITTNKGVVVVIRDGFSVSGAARKFAVSQQSPYRWMTLRGRRDRGARRTLAPSQAHPPPDAGVKAIPLSSTLVAP